MHRGNLGHLCQVGTGLVRMDVGSANIKNNCNQCKVNRRYIKECGEKKQKGRNSNAKKPQCRMESDNDW